MTILKSLTIVAALIAGGTSLAIAQNGPATGGQPPVGGGATGNPANMGPPGPGGAAAATTRHHRSMYMSAPGSRHKRLETGQPMSKQPRVQNGGY
jgi:hypothetical protein